MRFGCELTPFEQDAAAVSATSARPPARAQAKRYALHTSSAATAAPARCASSSASSSRAKATSGNSARRCSTARTYTNASRWATAATTTSPKGRIFPFIILQDSTRHWTLHAGVESDAEMVELFRHSLAMPIDFQTLSVNEWTQHLLCAERYGEGRVFIAGDAAHLVIPTGGLGMNTGVGDAIDLSWKLAATLAGWGGPHLLASYEPERRPIGLRNVKASGAAMQGRLSWRAAYHRTSATTPRWRGYARRNGAAFRRRAAQSHRDSGHRGRLPLRRFARDLARARRRPRPRQSRLRSHDLARRAPAARLARRCTALHDHPGSGYTLLRLGGTRARKPPLRTRLAGHRRAARRPRFRRATPRATSTATICCWCGPTCTWSGAATKLRMTPQPSPPSPPATPRWPGPKVLPGDDQKEQPYRIIIYFNEPVNPRWRERFGPHLSGTPVCRITLGSGLGSAGSESVCAGPGVQRHHAQSCSPAPPCEPRQSVIRTGGVHSIWLSATA